MSRKWIFLFLVVLATTTSCKKSNYVEALQGEWQVVEINYLLDNSSTPAPVGNTRFYFHNDQYETYSGDTLVEKGTYSVNGQITKLRFYSDSGNSTMKILDKDDTHQHWKSDYKITDFYMELRLEKIE